MLHIAIFISREFFFPIIFGSETFVISSIYRDLCSSCGEFGPVKKLAGVRFSALFPFSDATRIRFAQVSSLDLTIFFLFSIFFLLPSGLGWSIKRR